MMKKVIYIVIAVFALGLASCSKQDVQPNSPDPVVPVWKANTNTNDPGTTVTDPGTDPVIEDDGGITDPEIAN